MSQILEAVFDGQVIRPTETVDLPANTRVRVTVEALPTEPTKPVSFLALARSQNLSGPPDWSARLDDYLYGTSDPTAK